MTQSLPDQSDRESQLPVAAIAVAAFVAVQAATWLYFRARQPATDEQTRQRLRPRRGA